MRGIARQHEPSKDFYSMAIKQCEVCNNDFYVKPKKYNLRFCCSNACRDIRFKTTLKGENNPNFKNAKEVNKKECPVCKVYFYRANRSQKTCSLKCGILFSVKTKTYDHCRDKNSIQKRVQAIKNKVEERKKLGIHTGTCKCGNSKSHKSKRCKECFKKSVYKEVSKCVICGNNTKNWRHKTCSNTCFRNFQKKRYTNENNPNWRGGVRKPNATIRASEIYKEWRNEVFERDKYTCQDCGQIGWELHAHHIKPFSKYPELRTELSNGITLCKKCHSKHHPSLRNLKH